MDTIHDAQTAVRQLSPTDLAEFRKWFREFDAEAWDLQLEEDIRRGRLDALADEALADLREGRSSEL